MTSEPTLFPPPPPDGALTDRQRFVLDELQRAGFDGLDADEVGALLCERRGRHDRGSRCEWDGQNGREVLKALRKRGLAKSRRGGTWVALATVESGEHGSAAASAQLGPGDLPEDF